MLIRGRKTSLKRERIGIGRRKIGEFSEIWIIISHHFTFILRLDSEKCVTGNSILSLSASFHLITRFPSSSRVIISHGDIFWDDFFKSLPARYLSLPLNLNSGNLINYSHSLPLFCIRLFLLSFISHWFSLTLVRDHSDSVLFARLLIMVSVFLLSRFNIISTGNVSCVTGKKRPFEKCVSSLLPSAEVTHVPARPVQLVLPTPETAKVVRKTRGKQEEKKCRNQV